MKRSALPAALLLSALSATWADVTLAPLFQNGAVLQRDMPVPVWGQADPGEKVSVQFAGQKVSATADESGRWMASLTPLTASKKGRELVVEGNNKITLQDVLVGEVWLCNGQSNMEWPLKNSPEPEKVLAAAQHPLLRQFKVTTTSVEQPTATVKGSWIICTPETAGAFTAVGYYFAKTLMPKLDVPIGLINDTWGGTKIEAWMSAEARAAFPTIAERWKVALKDLPKKTEAYEKERIAFRQKAQEAKAAGTPFDVNKYPKPPPGPGTKEAPGGLFNGMTAPLVPYAIRGVLWYQGEGNTGRHDEYAKLQPAYIKDLRERWNNKELPFFFVQLPNYIAKVDATTKWPEFREAQSETLKVPNTGMAITIDVGGEGHPPDKTEVGERLARLAEVKVYKTASGDAMGPLAAAAQKADGGVKVTFTEVASGLKADGELKGFELAGGDGIFKDASAKIEGDALVVSSAEIVAPAKVRYAWRNNPAAPLENGLGIPASPFQLEVK